MVKSINSSIILKRCELIRIYNKGKKETVRRTARAKRRRMNERKRRGERQAGSRSLFGEIFLRFPSCDSNNLLLSEKENEKK